MSQLQKSSHPKETPRALYARIGLPIPVYQLYTWQVPQKFQDVITVGMRVKVPFNGRNKLGFVFELYNELEEENQGRDIKELTSLCEGYPILLPPSFALVEYITRRYGITNGEAARIVAPPELGRCRPENPLYRLAKDYRQKLSGFRSSFELLIQYLENCGAATLETIVNDLQITRPQIKRFKEREIIIETEISVIKALKKEREISRLDLTDQQQIAVNELLLQLDSTSGTETLLHGVTGSGKTEVYLRVMEEVLDQGGSVLYLVPEISLVPQTVNRVMRLAGDEAVIWHSRQNRSEKGEEFRKILQQKCRIVVGTRSAVFLPIPNLRLIIIDEEHDTSYVQTGDGAHDARDVARFLSKTTGAHLLYGSATPSMQQYHRAKLGEIKLLELTQRVGGLTMPQIMRVDLLGDGVGNDTISKQLRQEIDLELESGGQILLFLNRKGYAPVVLCRSCGEICRCRDCDVTLTYHQSSRSLLCHFCGYKIDTPKKCAKCSATSIKYVGMGTERIAEEARRFFPGARVVRFDAETIRNSEDLEKALEQVSSGGIDIIVGTQIFSKGHDFQGLTLVGMISADTSMSMPDFRASERTFQMIRQVTGRVGRDENPGRAIIQSYAGDHYAIKTAVEGDFSKFYEKEITYRKRYKYPPFTRMVRYLVTGLEEEKVEAGTEELYKELQQQVETDWVIHPPVMAPVYRIKQRFRRHILLFLPTGEDIPETLVKLREQVIKAKWLRGLSLLVMLDPEDVL